LFSDSQQAFAWLAEGKQKARSEANGAFSLKRSPIKGSCK
jgi:hypothetical protein